MDRNPTANGCKAVPEIHAVFCTKSNLLQFIDAIEKLHDDDSNEIYRSVKNEFYNFHFCSHYEKLLACLFQCYRNKVVCFIVIFYVLSTHSIIEM